VDPISLQSAVRGMEGRPERIYKARDSLESLVLVLNQLGSENATGMAALTLICCRLYSREHENKHRVDKFVLINSYQKQMRGLSGMSAQGRRTLQPSNSGRKQHLPSIHEILSRSARPILVQITSCCDMPQTLRFYSASSKRQRA
jgi:hypothetical protein